MTGAPILIIVRERMISFLYSPSKSRAPPIVDFSQFYLRLTYWDNVHSVIMEKKQKRCSINCEVKCDSSNVPEIENLAENVTRKCTVASA